MLVDTESVSPEELVIKHVLRNEIQNVLEAALTPRERLILELRFGLVDNQTHTLEQVGRELGFEGRMKLAMLTKVSSTQASSADDSPANLKIFDEAVSKIRKELGKP